MWPAIVIVGDELADDVIEMFEPEHDEVIESFMLEALNPPLDEGVQVGCARPERLYLHAPVGEDAVKLSRILAVEVTNDRRATELRCCGKCQKRLGLRVPTRRPACKSPAWRTLAGSQHG